MYFTFAVSLYTNFNMISNTFSTKLKEKIKVLRHVMLDFICVLLLYSLSNSLYKNCKTWQRLMQHLVTKLTIPVLVHGSLVLKLELRAQRVPQTGSANNNEIGKILSKN